MVLLTVFNLLFKALEITLYRQLSNEIGRQFFSLVQSPFFGINLIEAVLKDLLSVPALTQNTVYRCRGFLRTCQNFLIKQLLRPSIPEALFLNLFNPISWKFYSVKEWNEM
jgi:hypothetical protein